jgi:anti-sigma regulatory factor (Ser/Thr protein kinase)
MDVQTSTRFRRQPAAVPSARAFVDHVLRSAGLAPEVVDALVLAVAEACNNATLHAEGDTFTVTVTIDDSTCTLTVSDLGRGFRPPRRARMPSPDAVGQRGLALMEALVDHVDVSSSPAGTTVRLVHDLAASAAAAPRAPLVAER